LDELKKFQITRGYHTKIATIFLMVILIMSVATVSVTPHSMEATLITDLCETYEISCPDEPSPPLPSPTGKFFLARFFQYVDKDSQINIYKPNMDSEDGTLLRAQNGAVKSEYVKASLSLPGPASVSFISSKQVIDNAKKVKDLGFRFIEFNLEPDLSPDSDNDDVVGAMKKAAQAAHQQGLEFMATPSRDYTTTYGAQIAPFADYYNIQAQSLQERGVKAYSDYVHSIVPKLKKANSNLEVTVQVSTQRDNAPGLSLLETLKGCTDSIMDVADGATIWFGKSDLQTLKSFVVWYKNKY
jgi:hypothetical protein